MVGEFGMAKDSAKQNRQKKTRSFAPLRTMSGQKTPHHHRKSHPKGPEPIDRTLGCRYELKYQISEAKAAAVAHFIRPYLHLDHYCKSRPDKNYPVLTLYLDSKRLHLCRQTMEGQKNRFKLRIRSYTDELTYPRFFEIKRRMNALVIKSRARVMHPDVEEVLSGAPLSKPVYRSDEETLKQFQFYSRSIAAEPVLRVRYVRQAYEGDTENRVRVTFDRELSFNTEPGRNLSLGGNGWQRHSGNIVILEIKFPSRYPAWLSQMAKCLNLRQQSISKYVSSVNQSFLLGHCVPRLLA
jgi:hypothetical protein